VLELIIISQLSRNQRNSQLAFCLDSGTVGVVDLSTKQVTRMRTGHGNVCALCVSSSHGSW